MIQPFTLKVLVLWSSWPLQYVVLFPKKEAAFHHTK